MDVAELVAFSNAVTDKLVEHVKKTYDINEFDVRRTISVSPRRVVSWGGVTSKGRPFISVCAKKLFKPGKVQFHEYQSFKSDPIIGSIETDWKGAVAAIISHEMAHAVQHYRYPKKNALQAQRSADDWPSYDVIGHGELWKHIYRDLRINFINNKSYDNIEYTVTPVQPDKPTRSRSGIYYTKDMWRDGGRHIQYFRTSDGSLIGTLFKKEKFLVRYAAPTDTVFQRTQYKTVPDARANIIFPQIDKEHV